MIETTKTIRRSAVFLVFNATAAFFLMLFILAPMLSHFWIRAEDIAESVSQLSHFRNVALNAKSLTKTMALTGDPFLPGTEERVVSADLQANLKAIAASSDVRFLGIHGLPTGRSQQLRMVTVRIELEGPLAAIRSVILTIENQKPFLFVSAAYLRSVSDGDDRLIRAELGVQGAIRENRGTPPEAQAISR